MAGADARATALLSPRRLLLIAALLFAVLIAFFAAQNLANSAVYYRTPTEAQDKHIGPGVPTRLGGLVLPGTLQYDLYLNGDQSECMFIERYRDSEAAMFHAANLGDVFAAVLATVEVVHGELLGEPSPELREKLAGSDVPALFTPYRSMRRP